MTGGVAKAAVCPMTMSANTGNDDDDDDFVADDDLVMMLY